MDRLFVLAPDYQRFGHAVQRMLDDGDIEVAYVDNPVFISTNSDAGTIKLLGQSVTTDNVVFAPGCREGKCWGDIRHRLMVYGLELQALENIIDLPEEEER